MKTTRQYKILAFLTTAVLIAASLMAAWDGGFPTAAEAQLPSVIELSVRPIADVTVDQLPTITDITAGDAVLRFNSSLPLVCAIVYGKTTDYGMIAADMDMAGGAHSDHHPGLEPETSTPSGFRARPQTAPSSLERMPPLPPRSSSRPKTRTWPHRQPVVG